MSPQYRRYEFNRLCEDEGSFSMRPVLHRNVPNAGCRQVVLSSLGSHLPPGILNTTAAATTIARTRPTPRLVAIARFTHHFERQPMVHHGT